jgi:hypothetical protein
VANDAKISELVQRLDSTDERVSSEAGIALSERLESGEVTPDEVFEAVEQVFAAYQRRLAQLLPLQQAAGVGWMWEDDYAATRYEVELLLDLIGYLPTPEAETQLRAAMQFRDPLPKFWAVLGLLRQGKEVEQAVLDELAASPVTRNRLYHLLVEAEMPDRFPPACATQEAFATGDMVEWLSFPTELAREPDEIELMATVTDDLGEPYGQADYFVFRFRTLPPHWAAEQGWLSGISGPFLRTEAPSPDAHGQTFSTFKAWDETTPEALVREIQELFDGMLDDDEEEA